MALDKPLEELEKALAVESAASADGQVTEIVASTPESRYKKGLFGRRPSRGEAMEARAMLSPKEAMMFQRLQKLHDVPYAMLIRQFIRAEYTRTFHDTAHHEEGDYLKVG